MAGKRGPNKTSGMVSIKPVPDHFITGVPAEVQTVPKKVADELVKTGAFEVGGRVTVAAAEVGAETVETLETEAEAKESEENAEATEGAPSEAEEK